jgi:hypothetical protein
LAKRRPGDDFLAFICPPKRNRKINLHASVLHKKQTTYSSDKMAKALNDGSKQRRTTKPANPGASQIVVVTSFNPRTGRLLKSYCTSIGRTDIFRLRLSRAFKPGPAIVVAAKERSTRKRGRRGVKIRALMYATAQPGMLAVMSRIYTHPRFTSDVFVAADVFRAMLAIVRSYGFRVRYIVRQEASLVRQALTEVGFEETGVRTTRDGKRFLAFDSFSDRVFNAMGAAGSVLAIGPSHLLASLQLGATNDPPDIIDPQD